MVVGVNLPWSFTYCGYDFGLPPKGWRRRHPSPRDWEAEVGALLRRIHAAGVRVLRFFVLADARSYPDAGELPSLSDAYVRDVRGLLDLCDAIGLRAIPSFISFEAFFPPERLSDGTVKRGRGALALGDGRAAETAHLDRFFAATLDRLLAIPGPRGEPQHPAVLAWELVNEPDWVVRKGHASPRAMCRFLERGVERVVAAGYVASIGFVRADVSWMIPQLRSRLVELAGRSQYLHQLHYYPRGGDSLPSASSTPFATATILGEMAINDTARARWPDAEVAATERDEERYLIGRLLRAEQQGYRLAILWSLFAEDDKSGFDVSIERQIAEFTGAR